MLHLKAKFLLFMRQANRPKCKNLLTSLLLHRCKSNGANFHQFKRLANRPSSSLPCRDLLACPRANNPGELWLCQWVQIKTKEFPSPSNRLKISSSPWRSLLNAATQLRSIIRRSTTSTAWTESCQVLRSRLCWSYLSLGSWTMISTWRRLVNATTS